MSNLIETKIKTSFLCIDKSTTYQQSTYITIEEGEEGIYLWEGCIATKYKEVTYNDLIEKLKNNYDIVTQTARTVVTRIEQNINIKNR